MKISENQKLPFIDSLEREVGDHTLASLVKPHHALSDVSSEQEAGRRAEKFDVRLFLDSALSVRCECYLNGNAWLPLEINPGLCFIVRSTLE
ncbi:hypothetical protein GCM10007860_31010 [Chitiniphilus shinanonensis]|uniref:AraC family transcriptional regulator n=1 Tax=Chitiniphilus shinanonensis TaxID=553088 RepID=A0ABQ6BWZ3_9NEIS|nr:hypothetical protein [Chitiniphilus shinanonensis]GLS05937.1 hypothetical protein GCM10007860_31010 [Chitiniphilus shinanonensis]